MQAYVGKKIILHTTSEEAPDVEAIKEKLAGFKITIGDIQRDDSLLF